MIQYNMFTKILYRCHQEGVLRWPLQTPSEGEDFSNKKSAPFKILNRRGRVSRLAGSPKRQQRSRVETACSSSRYIRPTHSFCWNVNFLPHSYSDHIMCRRLRPTCLREGSSAREVLSLPSIPPSLQGLQRSNIMFWEDSDWS